ncbi:hypothetical protein BDV28DRAFT_163079 [Aspergillus coremiiformis]|uniref:Rhodopsin domain-containing protein n=1 Tax=Aspergillus coremiiformis TaxID=138285 RepID=A0A5N6ZCT6_9EURO|nr:hypothetical protein BDV28DRAFT_163079 [Aspergillus coremiiformis]
MMLGAAPNDNVPDRSWVILASSWPLHGLCVIVILLRLWTHVYIVPPLAWDDAFIVMSMVCSTVESVLMDISIHHGTGRHASDLTEYQRVMSAKYNWLSQGFHVMGTNWGKVSVAFFLLRIIRKAKNHQLPIYGGIALMSIINGVSVFTMYGQCTPTPRLWNPEVPGTCWDPIVQRNFAFFQSSASAFSDLIFAIYPITTIAGLQMPRKVKFGLGCVLSLGIIAMIAAIVKTINLASLSARADYSWDTVDLSIWIAIEQYLIILAACIPTLTPLFNTVISRLSTRRNTSTSRAGWSNRKKTISGPYTRGPTLVHFQGGNEDHDLRVYRGDVWATTQRGLGDGDSGDPIMDEEAGPGILKTTEIHIRTGEMDKQRS